MKTSAKGVKALELEEGVVLRAYRCPAGRWTIGAGLTAASGVISPKAGMVITSALATSLLQQALAAKYEPAVRAALTTRVAAPLQHEFDAGVSFHWNCGTIAKASWVKKWKAKADRASIRAAMLLWNKGGGKVLPGLTARREREAAMLLDGAYRGAEKPAPAPVAENFARWGISLTGPEIAAVRDGLLKLGYQPGPFANSVLRLAIIDFQRDHALTADGIIGRATLSTLQRRLDAKTKSVSAVGAPAAAATATSSGAVDVLTNLPGADWLILGAAALYGASVAYSYRDVIAAKLSHPFPRLANLLRSF